MMPNGLLWILALGLLPLAGAPFIALAQYRRFSVSCRAVLAAAVGAVVLNVSMTLLSLFGARWSLWSLAFTVGGIVAALSFGASRLGVTRRAQIERGHVRGGFRRISWAIVLLAAGSALVATALSYSTSADLVLHWGPKGDQFAAARTMNVSFLRDPYLSYVTGAYPPLVPNVYAFASIVAGRFSWGGAMLVFPILLLALSVALPSAIEASNGPVAAMPAAALMASLLASAGTALRLSGNGDMPLIFFEVLSVALLIGPARRDPAVQVLAGILIAGAATAKIEGSVFAVSAILLFLIVHRATFRWREAAFLAIPPALALGLWFAFGARYRLFLFYPSFGPLFALHWSRLGLVVGEIGRALLAVDLGLPFLLPIAIFAIGRPKCARGWIPAATGLIAALFLVFNYLHGESNPTEWIGWTAGRVLLPLPAFCVLSLHPQE